MHSLPSVVQRPCDTCALPACKCVVGVFLSLQVGISRSLRLSQPSVPLSHGERRSHPHLVSKETLRFASAIVYLDVYSYASLSSSRRLHRSESNLRSLCHSERYASFQHAHALVPS